MTEQSTPHLRIVDAVFERQSAAPASSRVVVLGALLAVLLHIGVGALGYSQRMTMESWSESVASRVHKAIAAEQTVAIEEPKHDETKPPEPPPPPTPEPIAPRVQAQPAPAAPPPPAQAAQIVAQEAESADVPGSTFVTGNAETFAGGVTATSGTSTTEGQAGAAISAAPSAPMVAAQAVAPHESLAAAVGLVDEDWTCPWPDEAAEVDFQETSVVVRAHVLANGHASTIAILRDPGFGFGRAAIRCAQTKAYRPARNASGTAIEADSSPILIHFYAQ